MRHDPERAAASYLGGELSGRARERFERHLLDCDDCWREVQAGRQGRALGESLREPAPARLRDLVRATVQASPPPQRPGAWLRRLTRRQHAPRSPPALLAGAALAATIVLLATQLTAPRPAGDGEVAGQPPVINAAVAGYRTGGPWAPSPHQPPARQLGTLR